LKGITDRASIRKQTTDARIQRAVEIVGDSDEQWIVWCGTDAEADGIHKRLGYSINVKGPMKADDKARAIENFQDGLIKRLITKPKIGGQGLNLQCCSNMIFLGLSDSYEAYYQCIRRCYRFGQTKPVNVYIVLSDAEQDIYRNVLRKEEEARKMSQKLIEHVREYEKEELQGFGMRFDYETDTIQTPDYTLMLGDSCVRMEEIPDDSIHLSVFSPPFAQLYVYSPTERDIGNCRTNDEFLYHFGFIVDELLRVTMPGRIVACHIADVPAMLVRDGYIGMKDLSGDVIRLFIDRGWVFDSRIPIDKNQQAQSIRTHAKGLTMTQKDKDRSWLRPALPDYILKFRKPGNNPIPVNNHMSGDEWIELANPTWPNQTDRCAEWGAWNTWYGIKETDTLNVAAARADKDERHICPLQLGTINRCIRLWSNPGETVLDCFGGIGSTGHEAILLKRKSISIELKPSYFKTNVHNHKEAIRKRDADTLFSVSK
jgi:DNA modification methylase